MVRTFLLSYFSCLTVSGLFETILYPLFPYPKISSNGFTIYIRGFEIPNRFLFPKMRIAVYNQSYGNM